MASIGKNSTTAAGGCSRHTVLALISAVLLILAACASGGEDASDPDSSAGGDADGEQQEDASRVAGDETGPADDGALEPLDPVAPLPGLVLSIVGGTTSALDNFGRGVAWSSDETRVAVPTSTGLYVYQLPEIEAPPLFLDSGLVGMNAATFAPDDTLVAGGDRTFTVGLRIWDVETGEEVAAWKLGPLLITWPEPDLMVVVEEERVIGFDPITGAIAWTAEGEGMAPPGEIAAVSADGRLVAHGAPGSIVIRETTTGDEVFATARSADLQAMALSGDGARVAAATEDSRMRIWDVASGELVLEEGITFVSSVRFDATGDRLVSAGDLIAAWDIDEIAAGGTRSSLRTELATGADWVGDGVLIADWPDYLPDAIVVDPTDASTIRELGGPTDIRIMALSPSATQLLSIDRDEVWLNSIDGTTARSTQDGPVEATSISTADISVDGTHVVALSSTPGAAPIILDIDQRESEVLPAQRAWSSVAFDHLDGGIVLYDGSDVEVVQGPPTATVDGPLGRDDSGGLDYGPTLRLIGRGQCIDVETRDGTPVGSFSVDSLDSAVATDDGQWVIREDSNRDVVDGLAIDGIRPGDGDGCRRPSVEWSIDVPDRTRSLRGISAAGDVLVQIDDELLRLDPETGSELGRVAFELPESDRAAILFTHPGDLVTATTPTGVVFFDLETGATLGSLPVTGIVRVDPTNKRALIYDSGELYVVEVPGPGG